MEKLVYLVWDRPSRSPAGLRAQFIDDLAPQLLACSPLGLQIDLDDDAAQVASMVAIPNDELPVRAVVSVWVDAHDTRAHSMAAATSRVPVIASRRVAPIRRGPGFRWKFRRTAHFIAVSHYVEQLLLEAAIGPERTSVVHDGVPVLAPHDDNASVVLALEQNRILDEAAQLSGTPIQFSSDLDTDLSSARVFLHVVHAESSGFPVLQAMARGVPVIASRLGALPELIEDGRTGLLTTNEAQAVASALARVLENPALAAEFSETGRTRAVERFSMEAMVRGTLAIYRAVLAPPPSSSS